MTFQPPPPSDNPPPPPPPPGQWGPQGARPATNAANVNPYDWAIMALGLLTFIFSFLSFYTAKASVKFGGQTVSASGHENAWHGFFGWFAALLAVAAAILVAVEVFAPQEFPSRLIALGCFGVAVLFMIIAGFYTPGVGDIPSEVHASFGRGVGFWFCLIFILAGTVITFMRAQQTGTKLPGPLANIPAIGPKAQPPSGF